MFPEPRYLQLEEELFPSITLYKELLFHNPFTAFHSVIFQRVAYDSLERTIDLTDCLHLVLKKCTYPHTQSTASMLILKYRCSTPSYKITDSSPTSLSTPTSPSDSSSCSSTYSPFDCAPSHPSLTPSQPPILPLNNQAS